jgi:uroporphyrinogen-III synthase
MTPQASKSQPLAGCRILVGRARHQASALSLSLRKLGAEVLEIPFIEIRKPHSFRPLDSALHNISAYDWLILTSVNGVDAMWDRLRKLRINPRSLRHLQIAAIGPATKKAIEMHGLTGSLVPEEYVAEAVVRSLSPRIGGTRVLLVRAKVARDVIPRELRKMGAQVAVVEAYETVIPESSRALLRSAMGNLQRRPHWITFTSSSSVRNFVDLLGEIEDLDGIKLASIGPVTSATLREFNLRPDIEASEYTIPGLTRAIVSSIAASERSPSSLGKLG